MSDADALAGRLRFGDPDASMGGGGADGGRAHRWRARATWC